MREKVGKSRNTVFFQWFVAPEGRKGLAKAAGAEPAGHRSDEKLHAVVARSTFQSQKCKKLAVSDHFWKLRCQKSARRCGAKHISKSKCTTHLSFGALLEVEMLKKCTPLWREAHFEVKSVKNWRSRTTFGGSDVEKVHAVVARTHFQVKMLKALGVWATFGGSDVSSLRFTTKDDITLHYTTLHYTPQHYNYNNATTLHYTKLHYTTLHSTTLHYTTLHYTTFHYTWLHYTTLHYTTLHYTTTTTAQLHSTTLHYTTLPSTTLDYITLHYTTLHYNYNYTTTLHYTKLH